MSGFSLQDLDKIVSDRARTGDSASYTHQLLSQGTSKCARKLGEEAVETILAAVEENADGLRGEAADLLYHLLVLLHSTGVSLESVMEELEMRTARSGLEEKASR